MEAKDRHVQYATSKDGTKIAYETAGTGPALLLVGGAMQTRADHLMGALLPLLAKDFTVFSYDRRGRGDSGDTKPYDATREIEDLESIVQAAGGSAYVFGNSSGGFLALLAAAESKSIKKIATYEAPFIKTPTAEAKAYLADLQATVDARKYGRAVKMFLKNIGMPSPMVTAMSLTPMWSGMKALAPTLVYDTVISGDGSVPSGLAAITVPTLLVTGSSDAMKRAAADVQKIIPAAKHVELKGQTHNVKPEVLAQKLISFFKG